MIKDTYIYICLPKYYNNINYNNMSGETKFGFKQPIQLYSGNYYLACGIGGVLSCGITHTMMTPLDLVKCNAQANPTVFPGAGMLLFIVTTI